MTSLTALTKKAKCKLTVCPLEENKEDQWMQVCVPVGWEGWSAQVNVPELKSRWEPSSRGLRLGPYWPLFFGRAGS